MFNAAFFKKCVALILIFSMGACSTSGPRYPADADPAASNEREHDQTDESETGDQASGSGTSKADETDKTEIEDAKTNRAVYIASVIISAIAGLLVLGKVADDVSEKIEKVIAAAIIAILLITAARESASEK